ncbi:cytidylyltransferase domain-containing protein [Flavobacterium terrisoli]|uniref:cytidylyltransferase domain-containing protein n=1 Tax=Flavobacterium terrisoli TaxID=3242195 RepID=UPI0025427978|nr:hypothetical protein [Flavobacterium buctense]
MVKEKVMCFMLQARLGSTRLPRKMILPFFNEKNILQLIIEKLKASFPEIPIVLATSIEPSNDELETLALQLGCLVHRGSEKDVLHRFIEAGQQFNFKNIIRVCADNPFLDVKEMQHLVKFTKENDQYDYVSFKVNNEPSIRTHFGFWTEFVTLETLERVNAKTKDEFYHEHVTNFIYQNPAAFKIKFLAVNPVLEGRKDVRMTLDTSTDFEMLSEIYKRLYLTYGNQFGIDEIVAFLDTHPDYKVAMTEQININSK